MCVVLSMRLVAFLTYTRYSTAALLQRISVQPMHNQHQLHASKLRAHTSIRNALNLDRHALGQLLNGNTATRRLVGEVLLVHAVHLGEVGHVIEEDVDLDLSSALFHYVSTMDSGVVSEWTKRTLTILSRATPASVRTPLMFSQHILVLSAMLPSIKLPLVSAGIWPETKTLGPATMACV